MRTIKFRAKSVHDDKWVYGFFVGNNDEPTIAGFDIWKGGSEDWSEEKIELHTVGQFTGLYDINEREIYEGDVVNFKRFNNKIATGIVQWDECNPCMCIEYITQYGQKDWEYDFVKCGKMVIEVIGNIIDNPELIEG